MLVDLYVGRMFGIVAWAWRLVQGWLFRVKVDVGFFLSGFSAGANKDCIRRRYFHTPDRSTGQSVHTFVASNEGFLRWPKATVLRGAEWGRMNRLNDPVHYGVDLLWANKKAGLGQVRPAPTTFYHPRLP